MSRLRPLMAGLAAGVSACASTGAVPPASELASTAPAAVVQYVLENSPSGERVVWRAFSDGLGGTVTPLRTFRGPAGFCRDFAVTVLAAEGGGATWQETACRDADGRWRLAAS